MIISDEQVQRVLDYLRNTTAKEPSTSSCDVPEVLLERVREVLDGLPDTREERVAEAAQRLRAEPPSADAVAAKIIARAISDSLR